VVRKTQVAWADPPATPNIVELPNGKPFPPVAKQIEGQLTERMKQEVTKIDARLLANASSPGATADDATLGGARPRLKEWLHADHGLIRGEGTLDYDLRGFRLTPDAAPRLFVRARWTLAGAPVFLMTAWFRADVPKQNEPAAEKGVNVKIVLLSADSSWSTILREGENPGSLGDSLDFQSVLNEFDADHDGWAELLMHSDRGSSSTISLYLYTDLGPVPMKMPFRRDAQSPELCVDP
jgi:hypothetical protein